MLPYLTQLLCPGIAILLQDGPDDLGVTDIHLAAVGLQVHCNKGRVTQEPAQLPSTTRPIPCSAGTSLNPTTGIREAAQKLPAPAAHKG